MLSLITSLTDDTTTESTNPFLTVKAQRLCHTNTQCDIERA